MVAVFTVFCLGAVLMGACGNYVLDNTFFFISVLFLSAILFYGINHNRDGQTPVLTWEYIRTHVQDLLQSVCFAGAISGCCEYMAGLYDIHHAMAERKEMLWFALAVIAMFSMKEIFNLYNLVYLIVAGIGGYFYYQNAVLQLAEKTIKETEIDWHLQVIRHTVMIAILLGLIVIRTLIGLVKKKLAKPDFAYAGLLLLFFAAIILFRNGRWWTVVMAVVLFQLRYVGAQGASAHQYLQGCDPAVSAGNRLGTASQTLYHLPHGQISPYFPYGNYYGNLSYRGGVRCDGDALK